MEGVGHVDEWAGLIVVVVVVVKMCMSRSCLFSCYLCCFESF